MKRVQEIPKIPKRKKDSHKGDYGRLLIFAGSREMTGAAVLTAQAALRSGVGLVTLAVTEEILYVVQSHLLESTFLALRKNTAQKQLATAARESSALVIGPGLGVSTQLRGVVKSGLALPLPLLLDADGLNVLEGNLSAIQKRKSPTVLTPHPGEMARLMKITTGRVQADREKIALLCANKTGAVVVLKGHQTVVTDGTRLYTNQTGNPGMAKAGMGDVLSGIIGAFLAKGMSAFESAVLGVYLHGLAGDLALKKWGEESLLASDLLNAFPVVMTTGVISTKV